MSYPTEGPKLIRGSVTGIPEPTRVEQHRRSDEERLRLLLETTNAIPWESDPKTWEFTYVGPQAVKILGYPLSRWYEPGFWQSQIHPEDRDTAISSCQRSAERCEDHTFEYRMVTSAGGIVSSRSICCPLKKSSCASSIKAESFNSSSFINSKDDDRSFSRE